MPAVCRLRTPSTCTAPSQPARSLRMRRCSAGVSTISSAQTTSPSRSSQPDRMAAEATGRPVALRLTVRPMSKRTVKRKLRTKKKANHGKKPNCGRG